MKGNHLIIKLFFLLMLAPQSGFTQYKSFFGKEVTSWNREIAGQMEPLVDSINILAIDTIRIDSLLYYKATHYVYEDYIGPLNYYYREDTTKGRLYHYDTITKTEFLVVDMSLNKGDTFRTNASADTFIVDSVFYVSGVKHINLSNLRWMVSVAHSFAEGVGALFLGFNIHDLWEGWWDQNFLLCQFKDGQHVYTNYLNANSPYCNRTRNSIHGTNKDSIIVYPNPAFGELHLKSYKTGLFEIQLINTLGQAVLQDYINLSTDASIDINSLPEGIYTLVIFDDNKNNIYKENIIIQ